MTHIFCCYAHEDNAYLDKLRVRLHPLYVQGFIHVWYDGEIIPGGQWKEEIEKQLEASHLIVLLISPDFFASSVVYETQMQHISERYERGEVKIVPIIVRPDANWRDMPIGTTKLGSLSVLPKGAKPVTTWTNEDEAWEDVTRGIKHIVDRSQSEQGGQHVSDSVTQTPALKHTRFFSQASLRNYGGIFLALVMVLTAISYSYLTHSSTNTNTHTTTPTVTPSSSNTGPTPTATTIIPNTAPVLDDPLNNTQNPYQWDTGAQGSATCSFQQGIGYSISAPHDSNGGGCNVGAPNETFTNFVYQIQMVINKGLQDSGSVGPGFCWDPHFLGGSNYSVMFDAQGHWTFGLLTGGSTGRIHFTSLLQRNSPSFRTGIGQPNTITIRVNRQKIDVQVNGQTLFSTIDTTLHGGTIGVGINPSAEDAEVVFQNAQVWRL